MHITIDDFHKLEIRIGEIKSVEKVPDTDKLLKLSVDFGEGSFRQIVSGISLYFSDPQVLVGKKCAFAYNLEPRIIKGLESQGMILAVSGGEGENSFFSLLETKIEVFPGSKVK
jgi:methionyl-tRNA synthetase